MRRESIHIPIPCKNPDEIDEAVGRYVRCLAGAGFLMLPSLHWREAEINGAIKNISGQLRKWHTAEYRMVSGIGFGGKIKMKLSPGEVTAWCDCYPEDADERTDSVFRRIDAATVAIAG